MGHAGHDVLVEPYKRLTASDMAAKQLLSRSAERSGVLQSVLPVYLIDSQEPMPHHARRWALLAQYPDMPKYKKFLKSNSCDCLLHFMPPFELEELMQLQPWGFPRRKRLTQDMVRVCTAPGQSQGCALHLYALSQVSSLLQVLERFLRLGGVPRDVFKNKIIGGPGLGGTLATMDLPRVTTADCAAYTPSAASSELTLITVPAWRTGQRPTCLQQADGTDCGCTLWQAAAVPCAGDFTNVQVEFRSLHVAKEMWDWVQSPYRQDQCVQLIACVAVSQSNQNSLMHALQTSASSPAVSAGSPFAWVRNTGMHEAFMHLFLPQGGVFQIRQRDDTELHVQVQASHRRLITASFFLAGR